MLYYNQGTSKHELENLFDFMDTEGKAKPSFLEFKRISEPNTE